MKLSKDLEKYFPHDVVRAGQEEMILDLDDAFSRGKTLLAHAPTGLGKTASSLSVAMKHARDHGKKIFFLTNRHTQHRIAVDTLQKMQEKSGENITCVDLIGKRWMCNHDVSGVFGMDFAEFCKTLVEKGECEFYNLIRAKKGLTVEGKAAIADIRSRGPLHNDSLIEFGKERRMCSYELALGLAKDTDVIIGDYYYLFNPFVRSTLFAKLECSLEDVIVIVDEGHNLPSRVTDMLSSTLTSNMLKNGIMEARKYNFEGIIGWLQELQKILTDLAEFEKNETEKLVREESFTQRVRMMMDYDELINQLELAADDVRKKQRKSYLGGIAAFLEEWQGANDGYARIISETVTKFGPMISLRYTCLDPAIVTKDVFSTVFGSVVMSGTLKPIFMYKDVLGISDVMEREYQSPFPAENKRTIIVPQTSTKYALRGDAMYKRIAEKCNDFSRLIPGNVALFFPSYWLRDQVGNYIQSSKKLFWEQRSMTKEEKDSFIAQFKAARLQGGILLGVTGANFAEGVDFPGDLLKGVVVVGLPLARPDIETKEVIKYYDGKYGKGWDYGYVYPAMNKCFQSAGRCIRSEKDRGVILYLDERFTWQNYFCCFEREGIIVSNDYEKILNSFFS